MVWWKKLLGMESKEVEEDAKYVLKKRTSKGGMKKVDQYLEPVTIDELYEELPSGIYVLHKYTKGKSGFEQIWGPVEVTDDGGDERPASQPKQQGSAIEQMVVVLKGMAELKAAAKGEFDVIAPFLGYGVGQSQPKSFLEQVTEAREQYASLEGIFGSKTTGAEPIKYKGEIPIWLHPQLIPELIDSSMDKIERRLDRWGIINEKSSSSTSDDNLPEFPQKPPPASPVSQDLKSELQPVEEEEIAFEPVVEEESEEEEEEPEEEVEEEE